MYQIARLVLCVVAFGTGSVALGAGPPADIASLVGECDACHGSGGVSGHGEIPTIAGISAIAHSDYLFAYQDEARPCTAHKFPQDPERAAKSMCDVVRDLSEAQVDALGEYYASHAFTPAKQEFDAEKAAAGEKIHTASCAKCHSEGGSNPEDDASILAGQWMPYLREAFAQFAAGTREQPKSMAAKTKTLRASDIEALLHYFASQQ